MRFKTTTKLLSLKQKKVKLESKASPAQFTFTLGLYKIKYTV